MRGIVEVSGRFDLSGQMRKITQILVLSLIGSVGFANKFPGTFEIFFVLSVGNFSVLVEMFFVHLLHFDVDLLRIRTLLFCLFRPDLAFLHSYFMPDQIAQHISHYVCDANHDIKPLFLMELRASKK